LSSWLGATGSPSESDWPRGAPLTAQEAAGIVVDVLDGLAYAHEAGLVHHDIGLHSVLLDHSGRACLAALGVGLRAGVPGQPRRPLLDLFGLRQACERDVLMVGLLLHRLLANQPALDEADLGKAVVRVGNEIVRLPWSTPQAVPDPCVRSPTGPRTGSSVNAI
jgi:serine/threonine protein kinase